VKILRAVWQHDFDVIAISPLLFQIIDPQNKLGCVKLLGAVSQVMLNFLKKLA